MKFYKEKLSRRVRWPIGVICFSLVYGQVYAQPLTLYKALKLAEQYAPTLRVNSAQIEGAENVVLASGILPNPSSGIYVQQWWLLFLCRLGFYLLSW